MIFKTRIIIPNSMIFKAESISKSKQRMMVNMKTQEKSQWSWNLMTMRNFSSKFKIDLILRKMWKLLNNFKMFSITERNQSQTLLFERKSPCLQVPILLNKNSNSLTGHLTSELLIAFMFRLNRASNSFQASQLCLARLVCLNSITRKFLILEVTLNYLSLIQTSSRVTLNFPS